MTDPQPPDRPERQASKLSIEEQVIDFLSREDAGEAPDVEEFLADLPDADRDECRDRIAAARKALTVLAKMNPAKAEAPGEAPAIPGFRIERPIGRGAVGTVYAAWDETLDRPVALKVLGRGTDEALRRRILDEARKTARLRDPAIVTVHSVVEGEERSAIVMEQVEGYSIDRAVARLDFRQRARLLQEIARALSVAHQGAIIHRDLKPENVLLTPELRPKILDFGLSLSLEEAEHRHGLFEGTPLYASPEQARGDRLTPASDLFSFGSLMFTVLTGEAPFPGETTPEVLERITSTDPPFPREVAAGIPEDLQAICLACLARDPAQRPSAWEVATDLGRFLGGEPARLRPALYGDILRRRIAEHTSELGGWERQGMISTVERDRLHLVYRRILADEDHWIIDARRLTLPQTALYTGTWVVVVAAVLLVWLVRDDLSAAARSLIPLGGSLALLGIGVVAQRRRELLASAAFLTGAVLSVVPAVLSLLGELGMLAEPVEGVTQLLEPTFTNGQLLAASLAGLTLSMGALARLRLTGFAWTTAALTVASALGLLLILGWLDREPEIQALWCLPLVALEGVALLFERRGRVRWALPFHLTALLVLVLALDVIASEGPTLALLGVAEAMPEPGLFLNHERQTAFSLALNGLLFILLMVLAERARSLDLRRGARILELVAPIHLLGALYANAQEQRDLQSVDIDVGIYLAAVVLLLALGPWRARWRFLLGGLLGLALGSHLLIDLGLVSKVPFALGLGATGLAGAIATYAYLVISPRPREGSGEPGGRMGEESTTKAARRHEEMHEEEGTGSS